jgi:propanol-preferring alcohol dehydrogenase
MAVNAAARSDRKIGAMTMLAMQITAPHTLEPREVAIPQPGPGEVLVEVAACGVCRTDLHIFDGDIGAPRLPLTPGHQVVGHVKKRGPGAFRFREGARVGIPWLGLACGRCDHCLSGRENLCDHPGFTGLHRDGGFARFALADERFCLKLPDALDDVHAAPLLCAGLIGHRAYVMTAGARRLGLYGFGGAGHLVAQIAVREGREVYGFTKPGDERAQAFARSLGCRWAGGSDATPPVPLDAAIVFAPAGEVVPRALAAVGKGCTVICAGIHMTDIPSFPYKLLWGERVLRSVANLTRRDGEAFLKVAAEANLRTVVREYRLEDANAALDDLRHGRFEGAAVLVPGKAARS